jgi:hypothetical protein
MRRGAFSSGVFRTLCEAGKWLWLDTGRALQIKVRIPLTAGEAGKVSGSHSPITYAAREKHLDAAANANAFTAQHQALKPPPQD